MNKDILKKLYLDNSLTKKDTHTDKRGFTIITKSGIEKIKFNHNIFVDYETIRCDKDFVVFKATSYINEEAKEIAFGSASDENCYNNFKVEVAQKRALARVVIATVGLSKAMGEEEINHQKKQIVNK